MRGIIFLQALFLAFPAVALAQTLPQPSADNPRIQTVGWVEGEEVLLTLLPMTGMTVMFEPGERIVRVSADGNSQFDLRVSAEQDSFLVLPRIQNASGTLSVETDRRNYRLRLRSSSDLMAAYVVRFEYEQAESKYAPPSNETTGQNWSYRLRGDRNVMPVSISDDGMQTQIIFSREQDLPAIFAIGPTGKEQVVNGYMRDGIFVIDRVWKELVFRIDKDKSTAQRNRKPDVIDG